MGSQDRLVEVESVERPVVEPPDSAGLAGTKTFRAYDQGQTFLLPPSLDDWLPQDHLARMIDALVKDTLDLSPTPVEHDGGTASIHELLQVGEEPADLCCGGG